VPMPADTSSMCRSTNASGACHPGRHSRSGPPMPDRRRRFGWQKKVLFPIPARIHGSDGLLRRRTVLFVVGVTWRRPITRSSDRLHECAFASGPVW